MRVTLHGGGSASESLPLAPGESLLLGRRPDVTAVGEPTLTGGTPREIPIASPSISANHALVACGANEVRIVDLGSRNGTWLQLPPLIPVTLRAAAEINLRLAPSFADRASDVPGDLRWTVRAEFADALVRVLGDWLERRGTPARIRLVPRLDPAPAEDLPGRISLAVEQDLMLYSNDTMDPQWLELLTRVERYVARQNAQLLAEEALTEEGMVIASPLMKQAVRQVIDAAERGARCLLLIGPSGSGKEGLARCFHRHTRQPGAFVSRNCSNYGVGKDLILSDLFGADRGAFTGATRQLTGAVEAAHGGTLLLDEIAELPLDVQPILLRFLDHGEYHRVGGKRPLQSNARIVGATNKDLRAACLRDQFRRDLWFRLSMEVVAVPALADRPEDVVAYLRARPFTGGGSLYDALAPEAVELVKGHRWEGNFRELINFAGRLPRDAVTIDGATCRRALEAGALHPIPGAPAPELRDESWAALAQRAADAFIEDQQTAGPNTWDEVKTYVESYLKPLLFASLSGADRMAHPSEIELRAVSDRLQADRGTAMRQLERYFARFGPRTAD